MRQFLPCKDRPGNVLSVSVYKPQGRPAMVVAIEGRLEYNNGRISSFITEAWGDDRQHRVPLSGNNTKKNREHAVAVMLSDLIDKGWVDAGTSIDVD